MGADLRALLVRPLCGLILPIVACAAAEAAPLTAAEATALLARAQAIDVKCHVLTPEDRAVLGHHVTHAGSLLTGRTSPQQAEAALAQGAAVGQSSTCSAEDKSLVRWTLVLAQRAASPAGSGASEMDRRHDLLVTGSIAPRKPVKLKTPRKAVVVKPRKPVGLKHYAGLARRYFRQLQCRTRWASQRTDVKAGRRLKTAGGKAAATRCN